MHISNALAFLTLDMLQNVWREWNYHLYVVRLTKRSHIGVVFLQFEHFKACIKMHKVIDEKFLYCVNEYLYNY